MTKIQLYFYCFLLEKFEVGRHIGKWSMTLKNLRYLIIFLNFGVNKVISQCILSCKTRAVRGHGDLGVL